MTDGTAPVSQSAPEPTVDEQLGALVRDYKTKIVREVLDRIVEAQLVALRQMYVDHGLEPPAHLYRGLGALSAWVPLAPLLAGSVLATVFGSLIRIKAACERGV